MALFVPIELLLACLALLWTPAFLCARFFTRCGDRLAQKGLQFILPVQFILAFSLSHAGQAIGLSDISQAFALIVVALSIAGALVSALLHQLEHL